MTSIIDFNQMGDPLSAGDLARLKMQSFPDELIVGSFDVHGIKTRLVTDSPAIAGAVGQMLSAFKLDDNNGSSAPDIEVLLFTVDALDEKTAFVPADTPMLYDWDAIKIYYSENRRYLQMGSQAWVCADIKERLAAGFVQRGIVESGWLIAHQVFFPLWGQLLKECGIYPFHAAGLVKNGKALLFPGRSGSGKSTLTLRLVKSGYRLLGDDMVFLRQVNGKVEALSFPEDINVTGKTLDLFPDLAKVKNFTENKLRQKSSFSIEELYPSCVTDSEVPSLLVFPEITGSRNTVLLPMSRTEALAFCMRFGLFFIDPSTTGKNFELLSQLVRQAGCHRMRSGTDQEPLERAVDGLLKQEPNQSAGEREE